VDADFLQEREARYQMHIPQDSPARGANRTRSHRGVAAGLKFRPLAVTALDTLEWFKAEPAERRARLELNLERDAELLAEWKARGA
jgi:2'-hydroxyisoflavone reductase